ncbi:MAG TPA: cation-transporting P-type ATPase, partial [Myxococcales bacterium]|nr:cation-transporting P-type ATPase [Myxococcales bacterium]
MRLQQLTASHALASLGTGPGGLSAAEVARRQAEFGPNEVERLRRKPLLLRLGAQFTHFFALVLWLAAAMAFAAEWSEPGG